MKYPYSQPHIEKQDIESVVEVLQQRFLTQGPVSDALESAISSLFSVHHAIVCNSGTAALHLLYKSLGLGPNAGLITTPVTFLATANAARFCEAPVAFADVERRSVELKREREDHSKFHKIFRV